MKIDKYLIFHLVRHNSSFYAQTPKEENVSQEAINEFFLSWSPRVRQIIGAHAMNMAGDWDWMGVFTADELSDWEAFREEYRRRSVTSLSVVCKRRRSLAEEKVEYFSPITKTSTCAPSSRVITTSVAGRKYLRAIRSVPSGKRGFGLKLRIHPLGAAMASQQIDEYPPRLAVRRAYAHRMANALAAVDFLFTQDETQRESSWYMFAMRYDEERANGVPLELFHQALLAEGLLEADVPSLTGPIGGLYLFRNLSEAMPRLYGDDWRPSHRDCPVSDKLGKSTICFPVWTAEGDKAMVDLYIKGLLKVCDAVSNGVLTASSEAVATSG